MLCNVIRPILVAVILFDLGEMFRRLVFCFGRHDYMCRLVSVSDSTMCVSMCAYDREHAMNEANRMFWIIVYDSIGLVRETTAQWCNFHKHTQVCARHNTTKKKHIHRETDRIGNLLASERARYNQQQHRMRSEWMSGKRQANHQAAIRRTCKPTACVSLSDGQSMWFCERKWECERSASMHVCVYRTSAAMFVQTTCKCVVFEYKIGSVAKMLDRITVVESNAQATQRKREWIGMRARVWDVDGVGRSAACNIQFELTKIASGLLLLK